MVATASWRKFYGAINDLVKCIVVVAVVTGCAAPPPISADTAPPQVVAPSPSASAGALRIAVYFATDRKPAPDGSTFSGEPNLARPYLSYGSVSVSVPEDRTPGEIRVPKWYDYFSRNDEKKFVLLKGISPMSADTFYASVGAAIKANSGKPAAFIYIHGYNNSFDDAARRTAQIAADLNLPTVPVFYSWPSQAKLQGYPVDEESSAWTQSHLLQFLSDFADKSQAADLYVIAHSMGNRPMTLALAALLERRPELIPRFKQIILAAPDINAAIFRDDIAPRFAKLRAPLTIYASANDKALHASYEFHKWTRLGDAKEKIVGIPGIDIIDASNITTNFMGHDYFASNRALLTDVAYLFSTGMPARARKGLKGMPAAKPEYWMFP